MDLPKAIATAAAKTSAVVARVETDQMSSPTPCTEFDVAALAAHMALPEMSIAAATKSEFSPQPFDAGAWQVRLRDGLAALPAAWATPGALEGMTNFGSGEMPAAQAASITLMELLIHGWDLAKATGQRFSVDDALGQMVYGIVEAGRPAGTEAGFFGQAVAVPDTASPFDRALGLSGRDPAWTP
jgi:uncharacterized protein (TIGR03086 family)